MIHIHLFKQHKIAYQQNDASMHECKSMSVATGTQTSSAKFPQMGAKPYGHWNELHQQNFHKYPH
jgi:hypothetical protein